MARIAAEDTTMCVLEACSAGRKGGPQCARGVQRRAHLSRNRRGSSEEAVGCGGSSKASSPGV
eukprot:7126449-Prymnesium_polylepis.1